MPRISATPPQLPADPTWFKHAVFYEVLVRAFFDASADGSG